MTGPFEIVGDDAPTCVDGVCAIPEDRLPEPIDEEPDTAV